ncbi:O-antigen polymerase [uncultured Winogradskyella sp.]|uniref:O-antigen polymerase n=1 Tax=uncultured Winogradskyella sp. TaxID=395353 RepID=UPI0026083B96|nr:O-antigen polymerase [uncultured Winogradskyella sp.]
MSLRNIFLVVYVIISSILFITFRCDPMVWTTFFVSFIIVSIIVYYHLFVEKHFSPFISAYIVFTYLFFLLAPIIQIGGFKDGVGKYATNLDYKVDLTLKTNGLIILFNLIFFLSYFFIKKRFTRKIIQPKQLKQERVLPLTIFVLFTISILVYFVTKDFIEDELYRPSWQISSYSIFELLLQKKVLFMIPLAVIILCYQYFKNHKKINNNTLIIALILVISFFILLWFKNPMTEKRNALGPIYIALIFLFFPKTLNSNVKVLSFLFFAMIILFPLFQVITHIDYSFEYIVNNPEILSEEFAKSNFATTFNTLNYDAFSNISATIDYVSYNGFAYGYQLLSGLLFFVPRAIWTSKPISTGELIGNYIVEEYNFNFTNLANPLVSEGYINFGIFGVLLMSIALAYFMVKHLIWLNRDDQLKRIMAFYFAIHLIFLLRGDFTNGYTYYIGTLMGVFLIPKIVHKSIKFALKK